MVLDEDRIAKRSDGLCHLLRLSSVLFANFNVTTAFYHTNF
jgi:hypothetical protein